jgi:hypothetical protein
MGSLMIKRILAWFHKPDSSIDYDNGYICNGVVVNPVNRSYEDGLPNGGRRVPKPPTRADIVARKLELMPDEALFR